ncbi:hypothetical protein GQ457_11G029480 [Hibiscus cannabinus]
MDFKFTICPTILVLWASPSLAQNVNVVIHGTSPIAKTDDNFVCVTLDWWPAEKCNYNQWPWEKAGLLNLDLTYPLLINAIKGDDPNLTGKILDPFYLNQVSQTYKGVLDVVKKFKPQSGAWVSETGGAFNSGSKDLSRTFVDGFWYLDQMGLASTHGEKVFCRQALIGGNYGLLDATTFVPSPDYFGALLWHRLMGSIVHAVSKEFDPNLRVYAHCANRKPGVSLVFINLSKDRSFNVTLSNLKSEDVGETNHEFGGKQNREECHLSVLGGDIKRNIVHLNNVPMVQT